MRNVNCHVYTLNGKVIRNRDVEHNYRQDSDFQYLTGFPEPEAVAVLVPGREHGEYVLFCRERDPERERWDGPRLGLDGARERLGLDDAFPIADLDEILPGLMEDRDHIYHSVGRDPAFDRQVIGWREFVWGIYWLWPGQAETNALDHRRQLPPSWQGTASTDMRCLQTTLDDLEARGYVHHIQRLMVTGNFALLAGIDPKEICEWYLAVYADAFDWVELPNTHGMAIFADGGLLASKPYAAGCGRIAA